MFSSSFGLSQQPQLRIKAVWLAYAFSMLCENGCLSSTAINPFQKVFELSARHIWCQWLNASFPSPLFGYSSNRTIQRPDQEDSFGDGSGIGEDEANEESEDSKCKVRHSHLDLFHRARWRLAPCSDLIYTTVVSTL